jgi:hypothetical protein
MFFGGETGSTIDIPAGKSLTVKTGFIFGFGPGTITVNLWINEDKISSTLKGFVIGPIVILNN